MDGPTQWVCKKGHTYTAALPIKSATCGKCAQDPTVKDPGMSPVGKPA